MRTFTKYTAILLIAMTTQSYGQDFHFSQFYNSPLLINPAHAGVFRGDHRITSTYKEQWRSVNFPYTSYGIMGDMKVFDRKNRNAHLGVGVSILKDVAGEVQMAKTQANFSMSGIVRLNQKNRLSAGIRSGIQQNSINPNNLRWGNQFDGTGFNGAIESHEAINAAPYNVSDFSLGVAYAFYNDVKRVASNNQTYLLASLGMHHVAKPQTGYQLGRDRLYHKYNLYLQGHLDIPNSDMAFQPTALLQKQGPNTEFVVGGLMRYRLKLESKYTGIFSESAIAVGAHYRVNDAIIPALNLELKRFGVGVSYDINVSSLRTASQYNGGIELSFRFINPNPFRYGGGTQYRFGV